MAMANFTRRSVLRGSLGLAAAGTLARPYIANAAASTAEAWFAQGFAKEEDASLKKMVADYEKASGNKIDLSIVPFAPLRQKAVASIQTGVVPDVMEVAELEFAPLQSWDDKLTDVGDIVETQKKDFLKLALDSSFLYNGVTNKRAYTMVPMKISGWPFHIWNSLVEKAGYKIADIPNTWDAFLDFFKPVQDSLRKQGMRNIYAYGYQLTANRVHPIATYNAFLIAYGGKDLVLPNSKLNTDDPQVRAAKGFMQYAVQPKVLNEYLKGGLGRWMLPIPEIVKSDPFWMKEDPHREAYAKLTLLAPTMPIYEVYNPGIAQENAEHLFSVAMFDVMNNGMAPEQAVDKAFKRAEAIFAKYPIAQS